MDIVKRNLVSIICGVVALLAVVLAFFPMGGYFADLQEKLGQSNKDGTALQQITKQSVNKPPNPLDPKTEPLGQFPTKAATEKGIEAVKAVREQTNTMMTEAISLNARAPLIDGVLPDNRDGTARESFKQAYYPAMAQLKAKMNATMALTAENVKKEKDRIYDEVFKPRLKTDSTGKPINDAQLKAEFDALVLTLPESMRADQSTKYTVFLKDDKALDYHVGIPPLETPSPPQLEDIWAAQLSFWIQQDVVDAIVKTNNTLGRKDASGKVVVDGAVIKQVVSLDIPKAYVLKGKRLPFGNTTAAGGSPGMMGMGRTPPAVAGAGAAATTDDTTTSASLNKEYTVSYTGRTSNALYDVMHFQVTVNADARNFRAFMANLTRNRFITILNAQVVGFDREIAQRVDGFSFGPDPMVALTLHCEAIFFREWTVYNPATKANGPMPMSVRKLLGIADPTPAP